MDTSRRAFIGGAAVAAGLSLLPGTALARVMRQKTFGVIEIRRGGMSVSAYVFDVENMAPSVRRSGFQRMAPQAADKTFAETELASPLGPAADDARAAQSVEIVAGYVDGLKSAHGLEARDIAVLVSGGLIDFDPERVARFIAGFPARTGITPEIVSVREQARLGYDWIVAPIQRDTVLQVDIDSGHIKGGYYARREGSDRFFDFSAPYGTKTMAGEVKLRWPETRTADFGSRSTEFYGDTVAPVLAPQIEAAPPPAERPEVCLSGGIVLATTVILHPEAIGRRAPSVELAPDHFAAVLRLIAEGTPYGGPLPASLGSDQRERVLSALERVRNTYNPHQLAAGAAIGDGLARQLHFDQREQLSFASLASLDSNTWVSQYLVEKFS